MKKLISLFLAVTMLLSLCSFALADDVVELELVFHKPEAIAIAGLQAVPGDMLEAAKIDGASGVQTLFQIIIPNVMPSVTICVFLTLTNSFKMFDQNMALTGGAPEVMLAGGAGKLKMTELLALNIYNTYNINKNWHGVAQAKAVVFFVLVAVLALAQLSATRKKEVQQ